MKKYPDCAHEGCTDCRDCSLSFYGNDCHGAKVRFTSLAEYAAAHGRDPATARQRATRGAFATAHKIGRNWVIDASEPWTDGRAVEPEAGFTGWCTVAGARIYCENGRALHGTAHNANGATVTVYPHRMADSGEWQRAKPRLQTLRAGLIRGSWKLM